MIDWSIKYEGRPPDRLAVVDWNARREAYVALVAARERAALSPDPEEGRADLQVAALATACWAAGLAALMAGRAEDAPPLLRRAAEVYRRSHELAPPGSWGRPLAALRCRLIAGDAAGARTDAEWALAEGADRAESPIARYTATLALLVLGRDADALPSAQALREGETFAPRAVADALAAVAAGDASAYAVAVEALIADFEARDAFLEDVAVADTVLVLDRLAGARGIGRAPRPSRLLP